MTIRSEGRLTTVLRRLVGDVQEFVGLVGEETETRIRARLEVRPEARPPFGGAEFAGPRPESPTGFGFLTQEQALGVARFVRRFIITRMQPQKEVRKRLETREQIIRPKNRQVLAFDWPDAPPEVRETFEPKQKYVRQLKGQGNLIVFFKYVTQRIREMVTEVITIPARDIELILEDYDVRDAFLRVFNK